MFTGIKDDILALKSTNISKMVDIAREERVEKADKFIEELKSFKSS